MEQAKQYTVVITCWGDFEDTKTTFSIEYARGICAGMRIADKSGYSGWILPDESDQLADEEPALHEELKTMGLID